MAETFVQSILDY